MSSLGIDAVSAILAIPAVAAVLLASLPGYRLTSRLNVFATFLTLCAAVALLFVRPPTGHYLLVDDTNIVFIMLGIYRTHEALEAAWKYFILGSVGIALALFGTILIYMAARPVVGEGVDAMLWTVLIQHVAAFDPGMLNVAFIFLLLGYGTKVG